MSKTESKIKSKSVECSKKMSFEECELAILRQSIDLAQEKIGKRVVNSPEIQKMIRIVEDFLKRKNLICYGGQGINEELPEDDRFYNKEIDIPDYDFYTPNALADAKELADIYLKQGYTEVEAKSAQHKGTYKVFVDYIPVADISYIPKELFNTLKKDAIRVAGILYAPPNFLRMGMYLELSRPAGDTDRWDKVVKRLALLNKHYPLTDKQCSTIEFQRQMDTPDQQTEIYDTVKTALINQGCVFFGGYAISMYSRYMPKAEQDQVKKIADFDVLAQDPETTAEIVKERLADKGIKNVKIIKRPNIGEVIAEQIEIRVGNDTIAVLYPPVACHSYNTIVINKQKVKIATIDTMLSFYLAFIYANKPYYDPDRILCMAKFLFDVQQKNRLAQKGLLRRFTITCFGHQDSVEEMRAEKAKKFVELKDKRGTKEYEEYFLNYRPGDVKQPQEKPIQQNSIKSIKFPQKPYYKKTMKREKQPFNPYNNNNYRKNYSKSYRKKGTTRRNGKKKNKYIFF